MAGSGSTARAQLAKIAGLALLYAALARLALMMAIPPGYATAFWPSAGIALAALLVFGYRIWPGVVLGSLLVNTPLSFDPSGPAAALESMALPLFISAGAALQALAGAFMVRRWVGFPTGLGELGRILVTMLVGGPVACLVSATVGVASLLASGSIAPAQAFLSWGTWWLGDSLGVMIVTPLASAWVMELDRVSRRTRVLVGVPILAAASIVVFAFLNTRAAEVRWAQSVFERRAEIMARTLDERMEGNLDVMRSIVSLLELRGEIERSEFRVFTEPIFAVHRDVHGLSWNAIATHEQLPALEERARQEGLADFRVTERGAAGDLVPVAVRDEYVVVFYMEPYEGNEQAFGFDLLSDPTRARALAAARDTGATIATPPILLVQETEPNPGFLFFSPIYAASEPRSTVEERRRSLESYASAVFRAGPMVGEALEPFAAEGIRLAIDDTTDPSDPGQLYRAKGFAEPPSDGPEWLGWSTDLEIAGRRWTLTFEGSLASIMATRGSKAWLVLTGGMLFASLLGAFLLLAAGRTAAAEQANQELRLEVAERLKVEEALRKREEERRKAEAEKAALEAKLQRARRLESLGVLAGGIAHDFNNLLVGVLGSADLAAGKLEPEHPAREHLGDIELSAQRAAELSNQLLAYSGKGKFVVEPIDLSELVDGLSKAIEASLPENVALRFDLATGLPALEADASQIRQVVLNLVRNAAEAVGETRGFVAVATGEIECHAHYLAGVFGAEDLGPGRYVFLEVSDSGCGMDEETRERIFDPFFSTKFTGRGLGLAAALGIVRGHQGAIDVRTEPGGGAKIRVLFPASRRPAAIAGESPAEDGWRSQGTVLLVEDEAMIRKVASRMLEKMGFEVLTAGDGVEALEIYRDRAERIDLVLLDLAMPRLDGGETFAEIRRIRADARVILSSGYPERETIESFDGAELAGFIQKPYRLDALREIVRSALGASG